MEDGKYPALYELFGGVPVNDFGGEGVKGFLSNICQSKFLMKYQSLFLKSKVLKRKESTDIAPLENALVQHVKVRNLMKDG